MNLAIIPKAAKTIGALATKNSPTLLTILGVTGLVGTAVMGIRATPKAIRILDQERYRREDEAIEDSDEKDGHYVIPPITKLDVVKLTWKCYIPTVIMGAITVGGIIGANSIHLRRNAALAGLYSLSDVAFKQYKAKVIETIGKPKEREIRDELHKDRLISNPVSDREVIFTGKGEVLCFDELSGRYFRSSMDQIKRVLVDLSRDLINDSPGFISVNDVYYGIGLSGIKLGGLMGWYSDDGTIEGDFGTQFADNGEPCLVLDYTITPRYAERSY
jgi:hypothetical protein